MSKPMVITYDGTRYPREECRRISDDWYKVGDPKIKDSGQCFLIGKKYVRINSGLIAWDHESQEYIRISGVPLLSGVVGPNMERGSFTPNYSRNVRLREYVPNCPRFTTSFVWCIDEDVATKNNYMYSIQDGFYYNMNNPDNNNTSRMFGFNGYAKAYDGVYEYFNLSNYSLSDYNPSNIKVVEKYSKRSKAVKINKILESFTYLLGGKSIGLEFETSDGVVKETDCFSLGLVPVKDGSIRGHEYVTLPLKSGPILSRVNSMCGVLSNYTVVNDQCSLHLHVGNLRNDETFLVAIYMLCYQLQHELSEMLPGFKRDARYLAKKGKDHCRYLPSLQLFHNTVYDSGKSMSESKSEIEELFNKIFMHLNEGNLDDKHNPKTKKHCREGQPKYNWKSRYYWVNFINLVFGNGTIEFRLHHATNNSFKVINWIFICIALVRYAETYSKEIISKEKFNLTDILRGYIDDFGNGVTDRGIFLAEYLSAYVLDRQEHFMKLSMKDDMYGDEFKKDNSFTFDLRKQNLFNYSGSKE